MDDSKKEQKLPVVKILAVNNENRSRIYSNYVEILKSPFDLALRFCDIRPGNIEENAKRESEKKVEAPIVADIIMPLAVGKAFYEALKSQLEKE